MQRLLKALDGFFYPNRCPNCGRTTPELELCSVCARGLLRIPPAERWLQASGELPERFAAFPYRDPLSNLLLRAKLGKDPALVAVLAALLRNELHGEARLRAVDRVVPMPMPWRRQHSRGFNQAAWLAAPLARALSVPCSEDRLWRHRSRPPQRTQTKAVRERQLRGTLLARLVRGECLLLVDDVETTGASLAEARRALASAGAVEVLAVTLLRASD